MPSALQMNPQQEQYLKFGIWPTVQEIVYNAFFLGWMKLRPETYSLLPCLESHCGFGFVLPTEIVKKVINQLRMIADNVW